jgi:nucleoside-diphosphate-sugar epimerase
MILVAGGTGMIGRNVVKILEAQSRDVKVCDKGNDFDLREPTDCFTAVRGADAVFHLADYTCGIGGSQSHHGEMMTNSLLISLNLLEAARRREIKNYLYASSSCVYPDALHQWEVLESDGNVGPPEQANEGYGWAKRIGEQQAVYYAKEHGMRTIIVRPANIYGPSYDWSNPHPHVIPSLIQKMLRGDEVIEVWGSGMQRRTFQYEQDTARIMVELMDRGSAGEAYNLGGHEMTIHELVGLLQTVCGHKGKIVFDGGQPEGPKRKAQNTEKLARTIGPTPNRPMLEGLALTVDAARKALSCSA